MYRRGKAIFKKTELVVELFVGGFSQGNFVLLSFAGKHPVQIDHSHEVIGSGADFGLNALNDRRQNIHMSLQRSVLHVAEALEKAKLDPGVGEPANWVILEKNRVRRLPAKRENILALRAKYQDKSSEDLVTDLQTRKDLMRTMY